MSGALLSSLKLDPSASPREEGRLQLPVLGAGALGTSAVRHYRVSRVAY